jgi:hypothetical protein
MQFNVENRRHSCTSHCLAIRFGSFFSIKNVFLLIYSESEKEGFCQKSKEGAKRVSKSKDNSLQSKDDEQSTFM